MGPGGQTGTGTGYSAGTRTETVQVIGQGTVQVLGKVQCMY